MPSLLSITRVLVTLTNNLVEVSHGDLGHQWFLNRATENGLHTSVTTHLLTDMVHDRHDRVLVPPFGILDRLNLASHDNDLAGRYKLATTVSGAQVLRNS